MTIAALGVCCSMILIMKEKVNGLLNLNTDWFVVYQCKMSDSSRHMSKPKNILDSNALIR